MTQVYSLGCKTEMNKEVLKVNFKQNRAALILNFQLDLQKKQLHKPP